MTYEPSLTTYHWAIVQAKELEAGKNLKSIHLKPSGVTLDNKGLLGILEAWIVGRQQQAIRSLVAVVSSQFCRKP